MACCKDCRDALDGAGSVDRADLLWPIEGGTFFCESCAHPDSPGVVEDDEILNFVVFDPQQVFSDGTLQPFALMQVDRMGLSLLRQGATDEEFRLTVFEMNPDPSVNKKLHGVVEFLASALRYDGSARLVGIYDTPLPKKRHHADMVAPRWPGAMSNNARKTLNKRRLAQLNSKMGAATPLAEFRGGFLVEMAVQQPGPLELPQ